MRVLTIFFFMCFAHKVCAQTNDFHILLDSAKTSFKKSAHLNQDELENFDYNKIVSLLDQAIQVNPNDPEARYFLAYTYSRLNAKDGRSLANMNLNLVLKASEQLEKVIKLSPKYTGEIVALDPYSKIAAEWGSLAMAFLRNNKIDSAVWAFKEGKKRGGFGKFVLELNKKVLNNCRENSILASLGDNNTFPLLYLQTVENFRRDVKIVDVTLLNTTWYPSYLTEANIVAFDLPKQTLDTIEFISWKARPITIKDFTWTVKPSYYNEYLLRGDRIFLSLLKQNKFQNDLYFTIGFHEDYQLSLKNHLTSQIFNYKLSKSSVSDSGDDEEQTTNATTALKLNELIDVNSSDEVDLFNHIRHQVIDEIYARMIHKDIKNATILRSALKLYGNEKQFPYATETKKFIALIDQQL